MMCMCYCLTWEQKHIYHLEHDVESNVTSPLLLDLLFPFKYVTLALQFPQRTHANPFVAFGKLKQYLIDWDYMVVCR